MKNKFKYCVVALALILFGCTGEKNSSKKENSPSNSQTSLSRQLQEKAEASAKKAPPEIKKIMQKAIADLKSSSVIKSALKKGDRIPEFTLPDIKRGSVSSTELLSKGPLVISFYRGGWCPYCNLQLRDLQKNLAEIRAQGAELVAISPEVPDSTAETVKKHNLDFYVLSDADGVVGKKFGLMFNLDEDLKGVYQKFGINLEKANGNKKWELPLAATYVVNTQGEIFYAFVDADYKKRAETTKLIEILKNLNKSPL